MSESFVTKFSDPFLDRIMQAGVDNPVTDAEMQEALRDRETAAARALSDFNKRNSTVCGIGWAAVTGVAVETPGKPHFISYGHMHLWTHAHPSCGASLQASSLRPGAGEGSGSATMTAMEAARAGRQAAAATTPRRDPTIYQSSIDFTHSSAKEGIKFDTVNAAGDLALPVEWRPLRTEYHAGSPVPAFVITLQVSSPTVANQEGFAGVWLLPAKDCPAMGILEVRKLPATGKHRQYGNCATLFGDVPMYCSIVSGFKSDKWVFEKVPATTRLGVQLMRDKFTIQMMIMPAGPADERGMIPIQIMAVLEGQIRFLLRPTGMKIQYGQTMFLKLLCQGEFNEIGIMRVHEVWRGTTFVSPEVLRSARPIPK